MFKDRSWLWAVGVFLFCLTLVIVNFKNTSSGYLSFSDSAKFADISKNLVNGRGFVSSFSFFSPSIYPIIKDGLFSARGVSVFTPSIIGLVFKMIGVSDFVVVGVSTFFFLATLIVVYLLSKNIFKSTSVAVLSTLAVGTNYDLITYATSGGSEAPFIFEITFVMYLLSLKKKKSNVLSIIVIILMYLTRPQAFIYIAGALLYYLLLNYKLNKSVLLFFTIGIACLIIDKFIIPIIPQNIFAISIFARGQNSLMQYMPGTSVSNALRGGVAFSSFVDILKKIFYNLYNFYKALPIIINPFIFAFFVISIIKMSKDKKESIFRVVVMLVVLVTFIVTAASIPFYRYLHSTIPLIYIVAVWTLTEIINLQFTIYNEFSIFNFKITRHVVVTLVSLLIVLFFTVGQTLGIIFLDSRFKKQLVNLGKPPVYVELAKILKENTASSDVIVTNLDTWGSWYGERSTVWFPLTPKQIIDPLSQTSNFNAIYLTDYLISDQNYSMGTEWRTIFDNPNDPSRWVCDGCDYIRSKFVLKDVYKVDSSDTYEKVDGESILLFKK